ICELRSRLFQEHEANRTFQSRVARRRIQHLQSPALHESRGRLASDRKSTWFSYFRLDHLYCFAAGCNYLRASDAGGSEVELLNRSKYQSKTPAEICRRFSFVPGIGYTLI